MIFEKVFSDWQSPTYPGIFSRFMNSHKIFTLGRLGGVDYEIAQMFYCNPNCFDDEKIYQCELHRANNFPGYFDFQNSKSNFILYAQKLVKYFKDFDFATYAGKNLIDKIDGDIYNEDDTKFLTHIMKNKSVMHYSFLESVMPFLHSFKDWGEGKTILVISPFSKSIDFQYHRLDKIIKNYTFPNFKLVTVNTNLTWQHNDDTQEKLGLLTNNWHEECDRLGEEIRKIDFDVAFLSCGSYAMFCGHFIKNEMHKKSIYIGGILGCLFGIYGKRYDNGFFMQFTEPQYRLTPFENEKVKNITAGRTCANESVFAYFGEPNK